MTTAKTAYAKMIENNMKYQERGYGVRVIVINECPDCHGIGIRCATCGNEPDQPEKLIKVRGKWYRKIDKS
jgi:hypothetical protein